MTTPIAILGCGWLGLPLAKALITQHYPVNGSTTSENKLSLLAENRIHPFLVSLHEEATKGDITAFLNGPEILIIDIPPKLRGDNPENFTAKIRNLIPHIETATVKQVLFISSTSVYADDNSEVSEATIPQPDTESGRQLLEAERLLQQNSHFQTTVLRFGGLIGSDRHPVKFLAGRENIENPESPINFIHQTDCIGIILTIIEQRQWGITFNAVAPVHPGREAYYTQKAAALALAVPKFNHQKPSVGKRINTDKLTTVLQYTFKVLDF